MPPLRCLFCQHDNPAAAHFCNECGTPLDLRPCTSCNAVDSRQATACYKCGAPFASAPARATAPAEPDHVEAEAASPVPVNAAPLPKGREPALAMSWQPPDDPSDGTAFDPRRSEVPPLVIRPRAAPVDLGDSDEDEGHGRDVPWGAAAALAAIAVIAALALAVDREGRRVVTVSSNATGSVTGTAPSLVAASPPASHPAEASAAVGAERPNPAGHATGDEPCAPAVVALGLCEAMPR